MLKAKVQARLVLLYQNEEGICVRYGHFLAGVPAVITDKAGPAVR